jgi:hypothetical protein
VLSTWRSIEQQCPEDGKRQMAPISINIRNFLRSRVSFDSESALIAGMGDFRRLIWSEIRVT